jgi:hypothetical protein
MAAGVQMQARAAVRGRSVGYAQLAPGDEDDAAAAAAAVEDGTASGSGGGDRRTAAMRTATQRAPATEGSADGAAPHTATASR